MDLPAMVKGQAFDLLGNAPFSPVLAIKKGRRYLEAQVSPAFHWMNKVQSPARWTNSKAAPLLRNPPRSLAFAIHNE
jgi:hypothetical protein